jgi:hypothetical protein
MMARREPPLLALQDVHAAARDPLARRAPRRVATVTVDAQTPAAILATAVAVAGAMAAAGRWVLGAVIREDVAPLQTTMAVLGERVATLTSVLAQSDVTRQKDREAVERSTAEMHDAVQAIRDVLSDHETRLIVLERPPDAKPAPRAKIRGRGQV